MPSLEPILRRMEAMNVSGAERHWALIPPELARRVRPRVVRIGDGVLTLMSGSDSLRHNRLIGLGRRGAAEPAMIDRAIAEARDAGLRRFSVMPAAGLQHATIVG